MRTLVSLSNLLNLGDTEVKLKAGQRAAFFDGKIEQTVKIIHVSKLHSGKTVYDIIPNKGAFKDTEISVGIEHFILD